jgi:hypothetical protein
MAWSKWIDLELDDDDKQDLMDQYSIPDGSADYPCGLRICLTQRELEMLDLEADCDVGDMIDLRILAKVCHVMKGEDNCRVELQAIAMKAESEDAEDEDDDDD